MLKICECESRTDNHRSFAHGVREMTKALVDAGAHRFPNARPAYVIVTRDYLHETCSMRLRDRLRAFRDPFERRDWLARDPQIKGLGYKESSHFLRNIGFKGYGI